MDREGFWFRLLAARFGLVGGRLQAGGREVSVWLQEIVSICDGVGTLVGSWFSDNALLVVGNGTSTLFWLDRWCGHIPLRRFRVLYNLSENKLFTVAQMYELGWGEG